jgi:hypothetical protein
MLSRWLRKSRWANLRNLRKSVLGQSHRHFVRCGRGSLLPLSGDPALGAEARPTAALDAAYLHKELP